MKKFYVKYWRNFANTYTLYWAETPEQEKMAAGCDCCKITRKEAEALCAKENCRRKENPAFSGYASSVILPIDYDNDDCWENDPRMVKHGYIVEPIKKEE